MGGDVPKQFQKLCGKPLIYYALKALEDSPVDEVVLVTNEDAFDYCQKEIIEKYGFRKAVSMAPGGGERAESVLNGVRAAKGRYVLIHDGARAFVTDEVIRRVMDGVQRYGAAAAAVPEKNTIREADDEGFAAGTPDRSKLWAMQTPQGFERERLLQAYRNLFGSDSDDGNEGTEESDSKETLSSLPDAGRFTDDVMIYTEGLHFQGARVRLVMGDYENIKVTTPGDRMLGEAILKRRAAGHL